MRTRAAIDAFLVSRKARGCRPATIRWYRGLLEPFCRVNPQLSQDAGRVELFLGALSASDETRHAYFRVLRVFYGWATRRKLLLENPMVDVVVGRPKRPAPFSLTAAELGYLLATPLSGRDRALLCLLVDTGVRIAEALGLTRDDLLEDTIVVTGKTGQREVPVSADARGQLLELAGNGSTWLFQGARGRLGYSGAYRIVRLAFRAAGISGRKSGPHVLRHTFGRQYVLAGGDLVSLQRILGHSNIQTTRIYAEMNLRDVTAQHHRFSPLRAALSGAQMQIWRGSGPGAGAGVEAPLQYRGDGR